MEQRRFVAFIALSFLVLMLHGMFFAPKPMPRKEPPPEGGIEQVQAEELADGIVADSKQPPAEQPRELVEMESLEEVDQEYVTLGSAAEDSPYRLLVTLTNTGAGVRRIELASSRFRDIHDRGGYLGHLELVADGESGLRVQAVGSGTPAEAAGLQVN
ncbi:MAG: hypothetical protein MI725_12675, partial [Pirellulales bacterium]|nr:hypothetical protein [Pirellulales bacterium]